MLGDINGNGTADGGDLQTLTGTLLLPTTDPNYLGADDFDGGLLTGQPNKGDQRPGDLQTSPADFLHTRSAASRPLH